jgi:hypothetical protein
MNESGFTLELKCDGFEEYMTLKERLYDGIHYKFTFPNGGWCSIIKRYGSYGNKEDLWEIMTPDKEVEGYLTDEDICRIMEGIKNE